MNTDRQCPVCLDRSSCEPIQELSSFTRAPTREALPSYQMFRCPRCESHFAEPRVSAPEEAYDHTVPHWRWEFSETISDLKARLSPQARVLEIGCHEGHFLAALVELFPAAEGLDFNRESIERARSRGLSVSARDINDMVGRPTEERYDAVCLFHVLEHVPSPELFLKTLSALLKPHGLIAFSVPNPDRMLLVLRREDWDYPANHLTRYSKTGLRKLCERTGLHLLKMADEPRDLGFFDFISQSIFAVTQRYGISWLYDPKVARWLRVLAKIPLAVALLPYASLKFLGARSRTGLSVYVLAQGSAQQ